MLQLFLLAFGASSRGLQFSYLITVCASRRQRGAVPATLHAQRTSPNYVCIGFQAILSSGMRNCWTSAPNFHEGVPTCSPPALSEARLCLRLVLAATFGVLLRQARPRTTGLIGLQEVSERNCLRLCAMQAIFGAFARSATDQAMQKPCPTTCPVVCPVLLARCGIVAVRPVNSVGSSLGGWSSFGLTPSPHKRLNIRPDPTAPQGLSDY